MKSSTVSLTFTMLTPGSTFKSQIESMWLLVTIQEFIIIDLNLSSSEIHNHRSEFEFK